jgi:hypothetical protein
MRVVRVEPCVLAADEVVDFAGLGGGVVAGLQPDGEAPGAKPELAHHERDRVGHGDRGVVLAERQLGGDQDVRVTPAVGEHTAARRRGQCADARVRTQTAGRGSGAPGAGQADPHPSAADRRAAWRAGHLDRLDDPVAGRVDPEHSAPNAVGHPYGTGSDGEPRRAPPDVDRSRDAVGIDAPDHT